MLGAVDAVRLPGMVDLGQAISRPAPRQVKRLRLRQLLQWNIDLVSDELHATTQPL